MVDKELVNALEVAIANEMRERKFYLKHAERAKNPLGKAMFRQIADDELVHYKKLRELETGWKTDENLPETIPAKIQGADLRDTLKHMINDLDALPQTDDDELEALQRAMDFEAKGAAYYAELRDAVTDPKEKAFFNLLATMEQEHFLVLQETKRYLTDPSKWFQKT